MFFIRRMSVLCSAHSYQFAVCWRGRSKLEGVGGAQPVDQTVDQKKKRSGFGSVLVAIQYILKYKNIIIQ